MTAKNNNSNKEDGYFHPGEESGGIHNLVLLYNGWYQGGQGNWNKEDIIPYISYVDKSGESIDCFFDGVLFLGLKSPRGGDFHDDINPSNLEDWKWYLDKTFGEQGDLYQLNEASQDVAIKLGEPQHKVNVVIMIPYPSYMQTEFGDLDGDGRSESFQYTDVGIEEAHYNKRKAIEWYINEVIERWNKRNYENLELKGLYWVREDGNIKVPKYTELVRFTSNLVHKHRLKFFWIPYFQASRFKDWREFGFDAVAMQPNYFFSQSVPLNRIEVTTIHSKEHNLGIEMETDERMLKDPSFRKKYLDYLNGGVIYGYMQNTFKAYYQGNTALLQAARSHDSNIRILYDWMYQFVKGTYEVQEVKDD